MKRALSFAALFLLPVLALIAHLADFPYQPGAAFSDIAISHYPNVLFLQQFIARWHVPPFWSPTILSGYPFAANPLSGLFYPPGWIALLFPLPLGFNLTVALHMLLAGVGMYLLLRVEGLAEGAALLGGLVFEAMPKLFSHLGAGHLTMIYAVAWTPWLLYAERRAGGSTRARWVLPGAVLGIIALADIRWAAYAGLLWLAYSLRRRVSWQQIRASLAIWMKSSLPGWLLTRWTNVLMALLIAAPLLLPLAQYTSLSTRKSMTAADNLALSMPPGQLFGLVYPPLGGAAEWMLYPGAAALALTLFCLGYAPARRKAGFWLAVLLITLLFALGENFPPLAWVLRLPGLDLLRVPPRMLFLSGLCFAAVAGIGLDALYRRIQPGDEAGKDFSGLLLFGVTAFVVLLAGAASFVVIQPLARIQFAWGGLALLPCAVIILLARAKRLSANRLTVLLFSFALIDLCSFNGLSIDFRPAQQVLAEGQPAAAYILQHAGGAPFRVYSPSYSIPQQVAAQYGLELADGVDPLQLNAYAGYMRQASGVDTPGYSVTLPAFAHGSPALDNQAAVPDLARLGLLNVRYLISQFDLPGSQLTLLARFGETRVYQNQLALPRAWVQPLDVPTGAQLLSQPQIQRGADRIDLQAVGPGLLVLSELSYPGWQVRVDGAPAQMQVVEGLLRGVVLADGSHSVEFVFRPMPVYAGLVLASLAWISLLATFFFKRGGQRG